MRRLKYNLRKKFFLIRAVLKDQPIMYKATVYGQVKIDSGVMYECIIRGNKVADQA